MTTDLKCPLADKTSSCPAIPLLREILNKQEAMDQKMGNVNVKVKSEKLLKFAHLSVNAMVVALQIEYPEKVWTSDSLAEVIGCSGATVRKTEQWRHYQQRLVNERLSRPKPKGTKDKRGNIEAEDWDEDGAE